MPPLGHTLIENQGAPTILYLHGFMGCGEDWRETIDRLDDNCSHLTLDLPGHGRTERMDGPFHTLPACAELVLDILDEIEIEKCHLIGYSMGGRLGLYLLTHFPERFDRAVIESASPGLKTERERAARRISDTQLQARILTTPWEQFLTEWYSQPLFSTIDQSDPRFTRLLDRRMKNRPGGLTMSLKHMGTGAQPSLWDELKDLAPRTLFVVGEKDEKYRAIANEMTSLCPASQVAIIPGAGHNVHFECPGEYGAEIARFLAAND